MQDGPTQYGGGQQPYGQGQGYGQSQQYGQGQQYGQNYPQGQGGSGYSGLGYFGSAPEPPPPPRKRWPWIAGAAGLVVILAAVIVTVVLSNGDSAKPQPQAAPPSSSSAPAPTMPTDISGNPADAKTAAVTPGWQGVKDTVDKTSYDVPPDWKVESPGQIVGYETDDGTKRITLHSTALYKAGVCGDADAQRGFSGFLSVSPGSDPDTIVRNGAHNLAAVAGAKKNTLPQVPVPQVNDTKVYNGVAARTATAVATVLDQGSCPAPQRKAVAVSFKTSSGQVLFLMVFDEGVADAPSQDTINKIISSLRGGSAS